jgi:hypothetical protein
MQHTPDTSEPHATRASGFSANSWEQPSPIAASLSPHHLVIAENSWIFVFSSYFFFQRLNQALFRVQENHQIEQVEVWVSFHTF